MSEIYKVVYNKDNEVNIIYVFASSLSKVGDKVINLNDFFETNQDSELFSYVFTQDELAEIKEESIMVKFVDDMIYKDDTIETIKKKNFISYS